MKSDILDENGQKIGSKYMLKGQLHRLDGPAVEYEDGTKQYFVLGEELTKDQFLKHKLVVKHRNREKIKKWIMGE